MSMWREDAGSPFWDDPTAPEAAEIVPGWLGRATSDPRGHGLIFTESRAVLGYVIDTLAAVAVVVGTLALVWR